MSGQYKLVVRERGGNGAGTYAGRKKAESVNFLSLAYTKRVNSPDLIRFTANPDDCAWVDDLMVDDQIEVWRKNDALDLDWYRDAAGFVQDWVQRDGPPPRSTVTAFGYLSYLERRIVAYKAGQEGYSMVTNVRAETAMKNLVKYNIGSLAGDALRVTSGVVDNSKAYSVVPTASAGGGNLVTVGFAWDNLLDTLRMLSRIGGGDFDLYPANTGQLTFEFYAGQRGTDRTATVFFSSTLGNVAEAEYEERWSEAKLRAIVGGPNNGTARSTQVVDSSEYTTDETTHREVFVDARSAESTALSAPGTNALDKAQVAREYRFKVLQTPACAYGVHYAVSGVMGDLVTVRVGAASDTQKVVGVTVSYEPGKAEQIDVELGNP